MKSVYTGIKKKVIVSSSPSASENESLPKIYEKKDSEIFP